MKILIVEDEPQAQLKLKRIISSLDPEMEVVQCFDSISESVLWLRGHQIDLIFMDVELADGSAFEIFKKVEVTAPIIFTTAYDEYAIQAFKVNSIDYLLKPIEEESVHHALLKYKKLKGLSMPLNNFNEALVNQIIGRFKSTSFTSRLMITVGERIKYLEIKDVAYFKSDGNLVYVICKDSGKFIINHTLDQLNGILDPSSFFRLNRSYIASISCIMDVRKHFNSRLKISIKPPVDDDVFISRIKVPEFLQWIGS